MSKVFFTADTHFNHGGIREDGSRKGSMKHRPQFKSLDEMHETIVTNWNNKVAKGDVVYHLGDFCFKPSQLRAWEEALNGSIHLILGNHDHEWPWSEKRIQKSGFVSVRPAHYLRHEGYKLYLHHYACRTWRSSNHGSFHLFGHSHGDIPGLNRSMDVGVDANNFTPVSFDEVLDRLSMEADTEHHPEKEEETR